MVNYYLLLVALFALIILLIKLVYDFFSNPLNQFFDKWVKTLMWLWLPFYTLKRLIREVILKK